MLKPKISAVVNTRNEVGNIRDCLQTLRWCDEIVVVDMESEDGTVAIAREFTDLIFSHPIIPAFDEAKQFGVEKSTGDWVLLVDADEMVSRSLAENLRAAAESGKADVVEIPFKHYIMGDWVRHSGWGYTPLPRFFRRGHVGFTGVIHDYMHKVPGARVLQLKPVDGNCILHFNYLDSRHFVEKLNRYTSVEALTLFQKGQNFSFPQLFWAPLREFLARYLKGRGYRDGMRGLALCLMMAFYRALSLIKLWEMDQNLSPEARYERIRQEVRAGWDDLPR